MQKKPLFMAVFDGFQDNIELKNDRGDWMVSWSQHKEEEKGLLKQNALET